MVYASPLLLNNIFLILQRRNRYILGNETNDEDISSISLKMLILTVHKPIAIIIFRQKTIFPRNGIEGPSNAIKTRRQPKITLFYCLSIRAYYLCSQNRNHFLSFMIWISIINVNDDEKK